MKAKLLYDNNKKEVELKGNEKLREVITKVGVNPETVLVKINNELFDAEERMSDIVKEVGDIREIELLKVISGG